MKRAIDRLANYKDKFGVTEESSFSTGVTPKEEKENNSIVRDRYKKVLYIGDEMTFLT